MGIKKAIERVKELEGFLKQRAESVDEPRKGNFEGGLIAISGEGGVLEILEEEATPNQFELYSTKEAIEKLCKAIRADQIFDDTSITCIASMLLQRGIKEEVGQ